MLETNTFYPRELNPLLKEIDGPVSSFELQADVRAKAREQAINEGHLLGIDFSDCPAFDDMNQKKTRFEAKRAYEIMKVIAREGAEGDALSEDRAGLLHAEGELASASIVESARRLKRETDPRARRLYTEEMERAQDVLFGPLDLELAQASVATWRKDILRRGKGAAMEQLAAFEQAYPWVSHATGEIPVLSDEKVGAFYEMLHERFNPLFAQLQEEVGTISNGTLAGTVNRYLQLRGFQDVKTGEGWRCVDDQRRSGFVVRAKSETIGSGRRMIPITWSRFEELMMHEVEVHLARAWNAKQRGALPFMSAALPGVADAEEGWGMAIERLWSGKTAMPVGRDVFRFATVAFADGGYDGQKHTEDGTFQFAKGMMALSQMAEKELGFAEAEKKSRAGAQDHTFRTFRGMPNGSVLRRNTGYLAGYAKAVRLIEGSDRSPAEIFSYLQQAKFDPASPEQVDLLPAYGLETLR